MRTIFSLCGPQRWNSDRQPWQQTSLPPGLTQKWNSVCIGKRILFLEVTSLEEWKQKILLETVGNLTITDSMDECLGLESFYFRLHCLWEAFESRERKRSYINPKFPFLRVGITLKPESRGEVLFFKNFRVVKIVWWLEGRSLGTFLLTGSIHVVQLSASLFLAVQELHPLGRSS